MFKGVSEEFKNLIQLSMLYGRSSLKYLSHELLVAVKLNETSEPEIAYEEALFKVTVPGTKKLQV